jgi:hypothetical protein
MLHYCSFNLIIIHVREPIEPIEHEESQFKSFQNYEEDNVVGINENF